MKGASQNPIAIVSFSLDSDVDSRRMLYSVLSEDEKQRAAQYRFDKHRNRFIAGRGRIREILAEKAGCSPRAIRFRENEYGKPAFDQPESARSIHFNASSSAEQGAIAISDGLPLGFDIEKINSADSRDYDLIVKNSFTSEEYNWYIEQGAGARIPAFFRLWTCKEAYLKALGIGLSGELHSFSIDFRSNEPFVRYTELENRDKSAFFLHQWRPEEEFFACLALAEENVDLNRSKW